MQSTSKGTKKGKKDAQLLPVLIANVKKVLEQQKKEQEAFFLEFQVMEGNASKIQEKLPVMSEKLQILSTIAGLLEASMHGAHKQRIAEILDYLEKISITTRGTMFGTNTSSLGKYKDKDSNQQVTSSITFLEEDSNQFLSIYQDLSDYYNAIVWSYNYPVNKYNEVLTPGIRVAKDSLIALSTSHDAMVDFFREYLIENKHVERPEMIKDEPKEKYEERCINKLTQEINNFVAKASYYDPQHRQMLATWLDVNGGQGNLFFTAKLITLDKEFFDDPKLEYSIADSHPRYTNWSITSDGKIQFEGSLDIFSIQMFDAETGVVKYMSRNKNNQIIYTDSPPNHDPQNNPPLLSIYTRSELEVAGVKAEMKVQPEMQELIVTSFAKELVSPKVKRGEERKMEKSILPNTIQSLVHTVQNLEKKYTSEQSAKRTKGKISSSAVVVDDRIDKTNAVIATIKSLLTASEHGDHYKNIQAVLSYIEQLRIAVPKFLAGEELLSLGSYMTRDFKLKSVNKPFDTQLPANEFSKDESRTLIEIYKEIYQYYNTMSWHFSYPLTNNEKFTNEVITPGMIAWKEDLSKIDTKNLHRSIGDFYRGYTIDGQGFKGRTGSQDGAVINAIDNFVDKGTKYDKGDQDLLKEWLKANGGQRNDHFLVNLLAMDKALQGENPGDATYSSHKFNLLSANWSISKDGKIQFEYNVTFQRMLMDGEEGNQFLFRDEKGNAKLDNSVPEDEDNTAPLMHVHARIELDFVIDEETKNRIVQPKMVALDLTSFASEQYIKSPQPQYKVVEEKLLEANTQRSGTITQDNK